MAHAPETKARALALLMTGNALGYVAKAVDVDRHTVRRWRDAAKVAGLWPKLDVDWRASFTCAGFRFARRFEQNAPKKENRPSDWDQFVAGEIDSREYLRRQS